MKATHRKTTRSKKPPTFVVRAEKAMLRAARTVRKQNRASNLPLIIWQDGKLVEKAA
jgi:hypothetical protein